MTSRVCDRCKKDAPVDSPACPHCGYQFGSHETTLRCAIHGTSYTGRVNAAGEVLSGHCPLCMESDDEEIDRLDKEIADLKTELSVLQKKAEGRKIAGLQIRVWGIIIFAIAAMGYTLGTLYSTRTFVPESIVCAFIALYLAATFFLPFLPLSPQWFTGSKITTIQNRLDEATLQKKNAVQRSLQT